MDFYISLTITEEGLGRNNHADTEKRLLGLLAAALIMQVSAKGQMRGYTQYVDLGALAFVLIGRLVFGGPAEQAPPLPKD